MLQEILAHLPDKEVTVVHSRSSLLSQQYPPQLAAQLLSQILNLGGKVVFDERVSPEVIKAGSGTVKLSNGTVIEGESLLYSPSLPLCCCSRLGSLSPADIVFFAGVTRPNTSLIRALDPSALDAKGFVIVDEHLKVSTLR